MFLTHLNMCLKSLSSQSIKVHLNAKCRDHRFIYEADLMISWYSQYNSNFFFMQCISLQQDFQPFDIYFIFLISVCMKKLLKYTTNQCQEKKSVDSAIMWNTNAHLFRVVNISHGLNSKDYCLIASIYQNQLVYTYIPQNACTHMHAHTCMHTCTCSHTCKSAYTSIYPIPSPPHTYSLVFWKGKCLINF